MRRKNVQARLLRALSGKTQEQTAEEVGVTPAMIAQIELDKVEPGAETLAGLAGTADLTVRDADEILRLAETLRRSRRWRDPAAEAVTHELAERLRSHLSRAWRRLSSLQLPETAPTAEAHRREDGMRERLESVMAESRPAGPVAEELQRWLLCEAVCEQSVREASRDIDSAAALARLAREIAERARGPEGNRLRGYAAAHEANILCVAGEWKSAEAGLQEAKRLWQSGSDPYDVLDPERLLEIEASLCRGQRPGAGRGLRVQGSPSRGLGRSAAAGHEVEDGVVSRRHEPGGRQTPSPGRQPWVRRRVDPTEPRQG